MTERRGTLWQKFRGIPMIDPQDRSLYTFVTGTDGGIQAIDDLCDEYRRAHANLRHALISIGVTSYMHKDRRIGRVKRPIFTLIGLVEDGRLYDAVLKAENGDISPTKPTPVEIERPAAGKMIEITSGRLAPETPPAAVEQPPAIHVENLDDGYAGFEPDFGP